MEQFFTSLSKRQTMLLLTSLAFGGSEAVGAYEHLTPDEEELLKHRAEGLNQIPRDKRVPLLVQEIKKLVQQRRRQLGNAEPKRLAALLKDERPALTEVVLSGIPGELAAAVRAELRMPNPVRLTREVKPEVLAIVRWKLETALRSGAAQVGSFRFSDVMALQQREILAVADRMGARVLATAVAGLGDAMADFLGKLPPDQRSLASKAAEAGAARRLTEKDAKLVLEMHGALENPSLGLRSAGVQRIIRAAYAQSPDFAKNLAGRHQGDLGKLLQRWLRDEKGKPVKGDGGRMDIVEQLERLAQKGVVDRPMRLPPPMPPPKPPPAPPVLQPQQPRSGEARGLTAPPARKPTGALQPMPVRRSLPEQPAGRPAGAPPRRPVPSPEASPTDSQVRRKVLRDGKPLPVRGENPLETQPPRRGTSPLQPIPQRKAPGEQRPAPSTNPNRSPVLKGPRRGPGDGSR